MKRNVITIVLCAAVVADLSAAALKTLIPYAEAEPILEVLRPHAPAELAATTPTTLRTVWTDWASRHDREIRARLARGDEDSIINFWLFGTSFTDQPRLTEQAWSGVDESPETAAIGRKRLDDLVAGLASPGGNERLQFARQVLLQHAIDPTTPAGRDRARRYLSDARVRMVGEIT